MPACRRIVSITRLTDSASASISFWAVRPCSTAAAKAAISRPMRTLFSSVPDSTCAGSPRRRSRMSASVEIWPTVTVPPSPAISLSAKPCAVLSQHTVTSVPPHSSSAVVAPSAPVRKNEDIACTRCGSPNRRTAG